MIYLYRLLGNAMMVACWTRYDEILDLKERGLDAVWTGTLSGWLAMREEDDGGDGFGWMIYS